MLLANCSTSVPHSALACCRPMPGCRGGPKVHPCLVAMRGRQSIGLPSVFSEDLINLRTRLAYFVFTNLTSHPLPNPPSLLSQRSGVLCASSERGVHRGRHG